MTKAIWMAAAVLPSVVVGGLVVFLAAQMIRRWWQDAQALKRREAVLEEMVRR